MDGKMINGCNRDDETISECFPFAECTDCSCYTEEDGSYVCTKFMKED